MSRSFLGTHVPLSPSQEGIRTGSGSRSESTTAQEPITGTSDQPSSGLASRGTIKSVSRLSSSPPSEKTPSINPAPEASTGSDLPELRTTDRVYENGYHFPPKHPFPESAIIACRAAIHYCITPVGFLVVFYGLNVVAWGGMLFLLLCNAAPAMCNPTCDHIDSPRRKWIEYDSQIVNALFCVTGLGLAPWRLRDLYLLLRYRTTGHVGSMRRLGGIHRSWLRLVESNTLPVFLGPETLESVDLTLYPERAVPLPPNSIPEPPRTGCRAPPTATWKVDFVVWMFASNTFLQCVLSGFMWGYNRYSRPSWAVGLFVGLACLAAGLGGLVMLLEEKRIKAIEGVIVTPSDLARLAHDIEIGIQHYNNLGDKRPKGSK